MTCIVGIAHEGKVILGADSAGVGGLDKRIRRDRKVFRNGDLIFGFTSSFRMGQLLQFALSPPPIVEGQFEAVGCGDSYAMGAMHALPGADPMTRLQAGLDAAAAFSAGVSGPFHFVELPAQSTTT